MALIAAIFMSLQYSEYSKQRSVLQLAMTQMLRTFVASHSQVGRHSCMMCLVRNSYLSQQGPAL